MLHFKSIKLKQVVIIFFVLILFIFVREVVKRKPKKEVIPARPVKTALAVQKDVQIYIESFGNMFSPNDVDIKPQVSGKILESHFETGSLVKKGDLLFIIDPEPYKAELAKSEAMLMQDQALLKLKQDTFDRNEKLFEKGFISKQDFESFKTDLLSTEAKVKLDAAGVDTAKINLEYCYICSPIDGLTGTREVDPGNVVSPASNQALVNIKVIDPLSLHFTVPETEFDMVRQALSQGNISVEVYPEDNDKNKHVGDVTFVDNKIDNSTGTVMLHASIPNSDRMLWVGEFVNVRLILGIDKNAVLVSEEAVELGQKGYYVFVINSDNKAELRQVEIGSKQDGYIVVKKGINNGEKIVVSGQMGLSPGASVVEIKDK